MNDLVNRFETIISNLDKKSQELFHSSVRTETYPKNKIVLNGGNVCNYTYVVLEGCIRKFYIKNGIEITSEFIFPDEMTVSLHSFLKRQPSREFLQTLDTTKVLLIPFSLFEFMQKEHPKILKTNFNLLVDYTMWLEQRLYNTQFHTAKERYQILLKTQPELIQKIPLMYISSYLGITLETLSRIRSQII